MLFNSSKFLLVGLALGASVGHAAQPVPVGVKVYVQAWNPLSPANDVPATAFASRDGISSGMNTAWDQGRKFMSDGSQRGSLRWRLEQPNLIASGITLRFLNFTLNPLAAIDLQPAGAGAFRIHWQIPDSYFDFKSTTPDAGGVGISRAADPELSFRFDLDITLAVSVADAPGGTLLTVTDIQVVPSHLNFDSHNFTGDAAKAAADAVTTFMKGDNFNAVLNQTLGGKNLAAPQNNGGHDLVKLANANLQSLNAQIANSGAMKYARIGLWARQSASAQALGLLFGVKALPLPTGTGGISGTMQFVPAVGQSARTLPTTCDGLFPKGGLDVEVQRGPRPVLDADPLNDSFNYGMAPMTVMPNAAFGGGAVGNGQCAYRLTGLSVWPNQISFPPPTVNGNGNNAASTVYWDVRAKSGVSPLVTCAAGGAACAGNYDLIARAAVAINAGKLSGRAKIVRPGDAVQNPSMYENAGAGFNSVQPAQTSVWGQPAAPGQKTISTFQQGQLQNQQNRLQNQKPNWNQGALAPNGQQ